MVKCVCGVCYVVALGPWASSPTQGYNANGSWVANRCHPGVDFGAGDQVRRGGCVGGVPPGTFIRKISRGGKSLPYLN